MTKIESSPCMRCGIDEQCAEKVNRINHPEIDELALNMFVKFGEDYKNCPLYVSLTAPDMVEEEDDE